MRVDVMGKNELIKQAQAIIDCEVHYCENCKQKQPIELVKYDPDSEGEPDLIQCMVCKEAIGFIENL